LGSKSVLIIATLDTKGREASFLADWIREFKLNPVLMDVGIGDSESKPEIKKEDVISLAGYTIHQVIEKGRPFYVRVMQKGALSIARKLLEEGSIHGVIGIGGGTGTSIATYIMRSLPYGFPKVMVSTVASRDVREYVGLKDIVMFHTVADLLGFNSFTRFILKKAATAIAAMVQDETKFFPDKPLIALTAYGINSKCASYIEPMVKKRGYELICFHANGTGGLAMEEMAKDGLIKGVLDLTLHEIADHVFGGYCKGAGEGRLEIECASGVPIVIAPGGLDNAVFSPHYPMPKKLSGRRIHHHDERFCVRMGGEEMELFAEIIANKLNNAKSPLKVLIPKRGFSEIDMEGQEFYDREAINLFSSELRKRLREDIEIEEVDCNISEPTFAKKAVDSLFSMMENL
jgi:uncharacterized protein (UPF0261 family)